MRKFVKVLFMTAGIAVLGAVLSSGIGSPFLYAQGFDMRGSVRALELGQDNSVYVGTFGRGMYRKADQGSRFQRINEGLDDPYILTLISTSQNEIFAGTARKGVYRSVDKGQHWKKVISGMGAKEIKALLFHQDILYAGTGNGVFKSTDHGENWAPFNTGMKRVLVRSMVMDKSGYLFAGTEGKGLYIRPPNSDSWKQLTRGFEGSQGVLENFIRILFLSSNGTMYAGTFDGGVYISRDKGNRWDWWSAGMKNESIRAMSQTKDGTLYVGTGKGVYSRGPDEDAWQLISEGLEDDSVQSMVVDQAGKVYVGTTMGLHRRNIEGTWSNITPGASEITYRPPKRPSIGSTPPSAEEL